MSLTASEIGNLLVALDEVFESSNNKQLNRPTPTIMALAERQEVRFASLENFLDGCRVADLVFLQSCGTPLDCSAVASCDIGGSAAESRHYSLAENLCKSMDFAVSFESCNNVFTPAMQRAFQIARHIKLIEIAINQAAVGFLNSSAMSVAQDTTQGGTTYDGIGGAAANPGVYVDYPTADWNSSILAKLLMTAALNDVDNPFLISGGLLWDTWLTAQFDNPACCDSGKSLLTRGGTDIVFDVKDVDSVIGTGQSMFAVDPAAYAFWSSNRFQNDTPQPWNDKNNTWVWRVASPTLTFNDGGVQRPVYYDIMRQVTCNIQSSGGNAYQTENYRILFNGGLYVSPETSCPPVADGDPATAGGGIIHFGDDGA